MRIHSLRRTLLCLSVCAMIAMLSACGSGVDTLHGTWACDVNATLDLSPEGKDMGQLERELAGKIFEGMRIEFDTAAKSVNVSIGPFSEKDTFTVLADKGDSLELQSSKGIMRIDIKDANTLLFSDPDDPKMHLVLKRAPK